MTSIERFDYPLPRERIAQEPSSERDASRALFVRRGTDRIHIGSFAELSDHLRGDECLILNDTRVIPARIRTRRATGGPVEVFLLRREGDGVWQAWLSPGRRIRVGEHLECRGEGSGETLQVQERAGSFWRVRVGDDSRVQRLGEVPLPPYIERTAGDSRLSELDAERYQTVYAKHPGAVAAPTAGLHFTDGLLSQLRARGIPLVSVTLHVGPGTFRPIRSAEVEDHRVEPELYEITEHARAELVRSKREGRRLLCVGTTSLRLLESLAAIDEGPTLRGETALTVRPGHQFRHADGLITNFHLPRSSLLVLVTAFHGYDQTLRAYALAVESGCRFYSYGDAMVILPRS